MIYNHAIFLALYPPGSCKFFLQNPHISLKQLFRKGSRIQTKTKSKRRSQDIQ